MKVSIGDLARSKKIYTSELVSLFSNVSGDNNPIHLDSDYASNTIFKRPIVHGMFVASQISEILANTLPGPGTIYLKQDLKFLSPAYHDDEIECVVEVLEIDAVKNNIILRTQCLNQDGVIVIDGTAKVKLLNS